MARRDCSGYTCLGGCVCYDTGLEEGRDSTVTEQTDEHDRELVEALWREVNKEIARSIKPWEDKMVLHGDNSGAQTVALLRDLQARLRPLFD